MTPSAYQGWRRLLFSWAGLILVGFLAVAGTFLWTEYRAQVLAYLPLLLVLAVCLGMHLFMHGGRGGGHDGGNDGDHGDRSR